MNQAIRFSYEKELIKAGSEYENLVVLDADVSNSTRTIGFAESYPERFFNCGIAEANMVCMAAGLATMGVIPIVNTFSFLLCERALDQIRSSVAYNNLNVKFGANYGGLSDSYDGASHHTIDDLAIIRSIPNMTMVVISDGNQLKKALPAIIEYDGPVYFRMCRAETPIIYSGDEEFTVGRGNILSEGEDLTIISTGILLGRALEAKGRLMQKGVSARVIDMHTIKPLDEELVLQSAKKTGALLTVEEATVIGGLGGAVAQTVSKNMPVPVEFIGIEDTYTQSGGYLELLDTYGMSVENIVQKSLNLIKRKNL